MILICEIKEVSLIKWHYVEVGWFALKIFSFEELVSLQNDISTILDWKHFGTKPSIFSLNHQTSFCSLVKKKIKNAM